MMAILKAMKESPEAVLNELERVLPNLREESARTNLSHWIEVLNYIDELLQKLIEQFKGLYGTYKEVELKEIASKITIILDLTKALLQKARNRNIYNSTNLLLEIIKLDDWSLVIKALLILVSIVDLSNRYQNDTRKKNTNELDEWLLNMAFGYSLKDEKKLTFIEVLKDSSLICADLYFQYCTSGKDPPTVTIIKLANLYTDPNSSEAIARKIASENSTPSELFNALWCKTRLAKTVTNPAIKEQVIVASLLSYAAFLFGSNSTFLGSQFIETEPKIKLIPSLIQLLKEKVSAVIHVCTFEVLTSLLMVSNNSSIGIDLFSTVTSQVAIFSPNGLIQKILKDITSVKVIKGSEYKAITNPETIPRETAENCEFALSTINFLSTFERSISRGHPTFMNGLISSLCNFLNPPVDNHYQFYLPVITKAMLLLNMFMRHNMEDYSMTDLIIKRLCLELESILDFKREVHYAEKELEVFKSYKQKPKDEHRLELCRSLCRLLSSSIRMSHQMSKYVINC